MDVDDESIKKSLTNPTQSEEELKVESKKSPLQQNIELNPAIKYSNDQRIQSRNDNLLNIQQLFTEKEPNIEERQIDQELRNNIIALKLQNFKSSETVQLNFQKQASNKKFQSTQQLQNPTKYKAFNKDINMSLQEQQTNLWAQVQNESPNTVNNLGFASQSEFSFKKSIIGREKNVNDEIIDFVNIENIASSSGKNEYSYRAILKDQLVGLNSSKSKISRGSFVSSKIKQADIGVQSFILTQNNFNTKTLLDDQKSQIKITDNSEIDVQQDIKQTKQKIISHEENFKKKLKELGESLDKKYQKQISVNKRKGEKLISPNSKKIYPPIILPNISHPSSNTSLSDQRFLKMQQQKRNIQYPPHLEINTQLHAQSKAASLQNELQTPMQRNPSNWFDEDHKFAQDQKNDKQNIQISTLVYSPTSQFFQTQKHISEAHKKIYSPLFNKTFYKGSPLRQQLKNIDEDLDKLQFLIKKQNLKSPTKKHTISPTRSPISTTHQQFTFNDQKEIIHSQIVKKEKDTSFYQTQKDLTSDFDVSTSVINSSKYKMSQQNSVINQKMIFSQKTSISKGILQNSTSSDSQIKLHLHNKQLADKLVNQNFLFSGQQSPQRNKSNIGTESTFSRKLGKAATDFTQKTKVFLYSK